MTFACKYHMAKEWKFYVGYVHLNLFEISLPRLKYVAMISKISHLKIQAVHNNHSTL